jgi:hypothetical protein
MRQARRGTSKQTPAALDSRATIPNARLLPSEYGYAMRAQTVCAPSAYASRWTLFLADQAACDIDPAVGPNHTGDTNAILILACPGVAELERRPLAQGRIG